MIAVIRDAGTDQHTRADVNGYYEGDVITYTWKAVELLLRVNPRTGEITLPKDDAERMAWREETERLASDGRNEESYCRLDSSETIGDVSLTLTRLGIAPLSHKLYVSYIIGGLYCPPEVHSSLPRVYLDGAELQTDYAAWHYTAEAAKIWVESYRGVGHIQLVCDVLQCGLFVAIAGEYLQRCVEDDLFVLSVSHIRFPLSGFIGVLPKV